MFRAQFACRQLQMQPTPDPRSRHPSPKVQLNFMMLTRSGHRETDRPRTWPLDRIHEGCRELLRAIAISNDNVSAARLNGATDFNRMQDRTDHENIWRCCTRASGIHPSARPHGEKISASRLLRGHDSRVPARPFGSSFVVPSDPSRCAALGQSCSRR